MNHSSRNLIGVVGDLHFFPDIKNPERWVIEFDRLGDWIVEEFRNRGIRWVVFMGDVFHGHAKGKTEKSVDFSVLGSVIRFFQKFDDFEIIILLGNHDCYHKDSAEDNGLLVFRNWKNIRVVDREPKFLYYTQSDEMVFEGEGDEIPINKFVFVPWGTDVGKIPTADTIFGHFDIQSFKYNAFKVSESGFSSEQLFRRSKNVVTGHYHHYQTRDYKKGNITYVGTPMEMNWGESDKVSSIWVFDASKCRLVEGIENTISPKHVKVLVSDLISKKVLAADVIPNNKVRIILDRDIDVEKINQFVGKLGGYKPDRIEVEQGAQPTFDVEGFETVCSTLDYREILGDYVDNMPVDDKDSLKEKAFEYFDRA